MSANQTNSETIWIGTDLCKWNMLNLERSQQVAPSATSGDRFTSIWGSQMTNGDYFWILWIMCEIQRRILDCLWRKRRNRLTSPRLIHVLHLSKPLVFLKELSKNVEVGF